MSNFSWSSFACRSPIYYYLICFFISLCLCDSSGINVVYRFSLSKSLNPLGIVIVVVSCLFRSLSSYTARTANHDMGELDTFVDSRRKRMVVAFVDRLKNRKHEKLADRKNASLNK